MFELFNFSVSKDDNLRLFFFVRNARRCSFCQESWFIYIVKKLKPLSLFVFLISFAYNLSLFEDGPFYVSLINF